MYSRAIKALSQGFYNARVQHLLQRSHKGLEFCSSRSLLHEEQAGERRVEGGAVAAVGRVVKKCKVLRSVVLQDVRCRLQLQQQLPAHVTGRKVL